VVNSLAVNCIERTDNNSPKDALKVSHILIKYYTYIVTMAGNKHNYKIINNTLKHIVKLLTTHNINNWFIGYGTLLGVVRDNSCIHNDDDVDILCDKNDYDIIRYILQNNGFTLWTHRPKNILKTNESNEYCSVDFYCAEIDNKGNFHDKWENVVWSECYIENTNKLIEKEWKNVKLYLPNNYELKLKLRYGDNWRIPQNNKGRRPRLKRI